MKKEYDFLLDRMNCIGDDAYHFFKVLALIISSLTLDYNYEKISLLDIYWNISRKNLYV